MEWGQTGHIFIIILTCRVWAAKTLECCKMQIKTLQSFANFINILFARKCIRSWGKIWKFWIQGISCDKCHYHFVASSQRSVCIRKLMRLLAGVLDEEYCPILSGFRLKLLNNAGSSLWQSSFQDAVVNAGRTVQQPDSSSTKPRSALSHWKLQCIGWSYNMLSFFVTNVSFFFFQAYFLFLL